MPKKAMGPNKTGGGGSTPNKTGGSGTTPNKTGGGGSTPSKTGGGGTTPNKTGGGGTTPNKTGGGSSANKTGGSASKTGRKPSSNKPGTPRGETPAHLGEPLSGLDYTLTYSGQEETEEGVTDDEGKLESDLPRGTDKAIVNIAERDMRLDIGDLDPPDTLKGYAGRLFNLDYYRGPISDRLTPKLYEAICKFQQDNEIPPLGTVDQETTDKLIELYGC